MTTLRLGYTNPLTDVFGAHPVLGGPLDLNDGQTFLLTSPEGLVLPAPVRTVLPSGNIRTRGERASRAVYARNREARATLVLGPAATGASLVQTLRTLVQWLQLPPQFPLTVQYQPPSGSAPVYLDVVACAHSIPTDEDAWLELQLEPIEIVFVARPGLRGDRVWLQNLALNPGFGAPSGPGVVAFSDPFTSVAAYSVQAGGAPTLNPANTYVDVVLANVPAGGALLRYYRLGETSGSVAKDISGQGQDGAYTGSPTLGAAGLVAADTDTAATFVQASNQYVASTSTGLPSGNAAVSMAVWFKIAANPASNANMFGLGSAVTAHQGMNMDVNPSGKLQVNNGSSGGVVITSGTTITTGVAHLAVATWDGTTMTLYLDGVSQGTSAPGAQSIAASPPLNVGADGGHSNGFDFNGQLDEACFYSGALSSTQVTNLYNAGHSGASGTVAAAMSLPGGARVAFGDPAWSSVNQWQTRMRYLAGGTYTFYLHYVDANNYAACVLSSTALSIVQVVGGVSNTLATAAVVAVHEAWYWLQVTQFPTPGQNAGLTPAQVNNPPVLQAVLLGDACGAPGAQVASVVGPFVSLSTAVAGQPQIQAAGAALAIGGAGGAHSVSLFGPGGWTFVNAGTALAFGVWEQNPANCYAGGPQQCSGAARIDLPSSGSVSASWQGYDAGAGVVASAPPAPSGHTVAGSAWVRSANLDGGAHLRLTVNEYDAGGGFLRQTVLQTLTGNQGAWVQLSGSVPLGANTVYVVPVLSVDNASITNANQSAWFDNVQLWDVTQTGVAAGQMPYCELRFWQSPAQLLVSGLLGDLPAPALLQFGTRVASWPVGSTITYAVGRAGRVSVTALLVAPGHGYYGTLFAPQATPVLDPSSYGGFYAKTQNNNLGWSPRAFSPRVSGVAGVFHLLERARMADAAPTAVQVRVRGDLLLDPWYNDLLTYRQAASYYGPFQNPLASANVWTLADSGQIQFPPFPLPGMADPTQFYAAPSTQWLGSSGTLYEADANWQALLPIDGSLLYGQYINPSNQGAAAPLGASWLWAYADGLLVNRASAQDGPALAYSIENLATPNPAHAVGSSGTATTGVVSINGSADPYLVLDPGLTLPGQTGANAGGVNQLVAIEADAAGTVLPCCADVLYSPLYLWAR